MTKSLLKLAMLFCCTLSFGQQTAAGFGVVTQTSTNHYTKMNSLGASALSENTIGSPFLYDTFRFGKVLKGDEEIVSQVWLRYDVLNDSFEGKLDGSASDNTAKVVVKSPEYQIKIMNELFIAIKDGVRTSYYQVLHSGEKASLLKRHTKKFLPEIQATSSMTRSVPPTFKDRFAYYYRDGAGEISEIPSSKGKLIKLFKGKESEVKSYIKQNKLNTSKEKDLIKLLSYIDSL